MKLLNFPYTLQFEQVFFPFGQFQKFKLKLGWKNVYKI